MKVILLKAIGRLGTEGEVVTVKDGYATNFLIPEGAALPATGKNYKRLEELKRTRVKVAEKEKQQFLGLKEQIEKLSLTITVEAKDDEGLYGSINETQIAKLLKAENFEIDKNMIALPEPIDKLGVYNVPIRLHAQVTASLRLWVMRK